MCAEFSTLDGECEIFHVKFLAQSVFGNTMLLPVPSLLIMFSPLNFPGLNMGIGAVSNGLSSLNNLD